MGVLWSNEEVAALLAAWSKDSIQRQPLEAVRNTVLYKAITEELRRQGFSCDYKQCRETVKAQKKKVKEWTCRATLAPDSTTWVGLT